MRCEIPSHLPSRLTISLPDFYWSTQTMLTEPLEVGGGVYDVPHRPKLGVESDEAGAGQHPFEQEVLMAYHHADGSVADW